MTKSFKIVALSAFAAIGLASAATAQQSGPQKADANRSTQSTKSSQNGMMNHGQMMMNDPEMRKQMTEMMDHCGKMMKQMGNMQMGPQPKN